MKILNRTKIVATLGPASRTPESIVKLIEAGVNVFRLNAAHADHKILVRDIRRVRKAARSVKSGTGILVDLQGPKIRVGSFREAEPIWLQSGQSLIMVCDSDFVTEVPSEGEMTRIGCRYPGLADDVRKGERILLDDGNIELKAVKIDGNEIHVEVVYGGLLKQHKGINLPGSKVSMSCLEPKDLADLKVVLEHDVDFIALSFVRTPADVEQLKGLVEEAGSDARVIAKIERPEAVENIEAIIAVADGVMVARGDMGVELGPELVPGIQKRIIRMSNEAGKPVITATQMLETMISAPRPTRAEASDVANAIYDGTSAVMLSAETASGKYPLETVEIMTQIINQSESDLYEGWDCTSRRFGDVEAGSLSVSSATVRAAARAAHEVDATAIAVFTESGSAAQILASQRTPTRIVAFTPFQRTVHRMALSWGVTAMRVSRTRTSHEMTLEGERILIREGISQVGDHIVVIVGHTRRSGLANIMNIRRLGDEEE